MAGRVLPLPGHAEARNQEDHHALFERRGAEGSSLALDSQGLESSRGFEDWAAEYGFDTDSRKAEKLYKACLDVSEKLKRFLGDEQYDQLLNHTEQL